MSSFFWDVNKDDVHCFNKFALVLMRLGVVDYLQMDMWEERSAPGGMWELVPDEDDYVEEHVSVSIVDGDDKFGSYDIK